jgi:DNA repair protein RecN (Recombination protein N)
MLIELGITDFAIIERLRLRLGDAFNVITGETGAGKSIIIDALGTLRGERVDASFVRSGCDRARVEGVFSLRPDSEVVPLLQEYGLWDQDDEQLILSREINRESGRSVARVNGRAVSMAVLREIGAHLVDIHGQHEGLSLFNPRTHLDMLDQFGGLMGLRGRVGELVGQVRAVREELAQLRRNEARRAERLQELQFLIEDVTAANLRVGEEQELLHERHLLQNGAKIADLTGKAYTLLYAGSDEGRVPIRAASELLDEVASALASLAEIDGAAQPLAEQANDLLYRAEDVVAALRAYRDGQEFDPARLDEIEDRLTLLRNLERRYNAPVATILERLATAQTEIDKLLNSAEHAAALEAQEARLLGQLGEQAGQLSSLRRAAGEQLSRQIEQAMADLAMPRVRFAVALTREPSADGVAVDGESVAFDKIGIDKGEFMLAPNPGEPLKPLAKIASGGESSRLLLAIKSILSAVDAVPTLIFDEVDVGVGGRSGQVVGEKLWRLTAEHQVICITHLPQVAAFADNHYVVAKQHGDDRTSTSIVLIDAERQVEELAMMLDGTPSEHSRRSAADMMRRAREAKLVQRTAEHEAVGLGEA